MELEKLGAYLRDFRKEAGLTLDQLSSASGVNKSTICAMEKGKANPSIVLLSRVLEACGAELYLRRK